MSGMRRAAFVAVGSELLRAQRLDTNSLLAARLAAACGFTFVEKRAIEDDVDAIAAAVRELVGEVELVIVSGGLGPTADDVTREGVAKAFDLAIGRLPALEAALEARFRRSGRAMPAIAARMADVLESAEVLPNPQGTAPGQLLQIGASLLVLLPGVPRELETIFATHLLPRFASQARVATRTLHLAGVYESAVEERVSHLYDVYGRDNVTILAGRGLVDLVLSAHGDGAADTVAAMERDFARVAGDDLFGFDRDTLAAVVLAALRQRGWRVATAESCTGGMIGAQLTAVPGASDVFVGGVVAYADHVKVGQLGVGAALLAAHGAVSAEVAEAMAEGARRLGAECAIGVTGIAGPGGGSDEKPVGTVHIAVCTPGGTRRFQQRFPGDRAFVRELAANVAIDRLRRALAEA
jgi:nicotinamide-nucleotide amidase